MQKWLVLFSVGIVILLVNLDSTIVSLALADIAQSLQVNLTQLQWIFAAYFLAAAMFFTVLGRLADLYGRRKLFLLGTTLFTLASLGCALAPNLSILLIFRFLQGVGFGTLGLSLVLLSQAFPPEQRGMATGFGVMLTGVGQALGPSLGGVILHYFNWHMIFYLNVPLGILAFVLTLIFVAKDEPQATTKKVDWMGALLFGVGVGFIALASNQFNMWDKKLVGVCFLIGLLVLLYFYFKSKKEAEPFIALNLLHHTEFRKIIVVRFVFMFIWMMWVFLLPLFLQNIVGFSVLKTGFILLLSTGVMAIVSPLAGKLSDYSGFKPMIVFSIVALILLCIGFAYLTTSPSLIYLALLLILLGITSGVHIPTTLHALTHVIPKNQSGTAVGLFFTCAVLGAVLGVAFSGVIIDWCSQVHLQILLAQNHLTINAEKLIYLEQMANASRDVHVLQTHFAPQLWQQLTQLSKLSFIHAFSSLMWINVILSGIVFWLACKIKS